jgi:formate hydrogenlyase subunit 6/NADH:ubiquinone oxidoreductase subunit I
MTGEDALEFIMAGASLVQVCTAAILEGPTVYGRIARETKQWMENHGMDSLEDIRGSALKHLKKREVKKHPNVDMSLCTLCGLCVKSCVYDAITIDKSERTLAIDDSKCVRCGLCVSVCPYHALSMTS